MGFDRSPSIDSTRLRWACLKADFLNRRALSCSGNIFFENYLPLAAASFFIWLARGLPCFSNAFS
jgi:hypothetical protein